MRPRSTLNRAGLTLLEILLVMAILGVLLGMAGIWMEPPSSRLMANDLKSMVQQARYEAVKRNQPVAFVFDEANDRFYTSLDTSSPMASQACTGDTVLRSRNLDEYRQVQVVSEMPAGGVVWLPSGQGRNCTGAPMVSTSIAITSGTTTSTIQIRMGGKVSVE